jgi:hypothetical protein
MRKIRMCWEEKKKLCLYKGQSFLNKTINNWTVLGYSHTKEKPSGSSVYWKCKCNLCGDIKQIMSYNILSNKSKSCFSCSMKNNFGEKNPNWKGYKKIPASLLTSIKSSAKSRNLEYNLSDEYLNDLWEKQKEKCALSGEKLMIKAKGKNIDPWQNNASLDRIDSAKGYIAGNVQWIHPIVNFMKNRFSQDTFIYFCKKISENAELCSNSKSESMNLTTT